MNPLIFTLEKTTLSYGAEAPILLDQVVSVRFGDLVIPWEPQEA